MPWRDLLSSAQRTQVLALPTTLREFEELYTLTPADCEFVAARRTATNRLGIAVQLCFLRHPGRAWTPEEVVPAGMLRFIASQIEGSADDLAAYAARDETRREHLADLLHEFGFATFGVDDYRTLSSWLTEQARGTDNGMALVAMVIAEVRRRRIVLPILSVIERLVLGARARARQRAYTALAKDLTLEQRHKLDGILDSRSDSHQTHLGWVRQTLGAANPVNILECLERLTFLRGLGVPGEWANRLHQNRLVQIAREGASTDVAHLRTFASDRRYATLVACVLDAMTALTDEALEMHERFLGKQFRKAERKHLTTFQENGRAIHETLQRYAELGRALIGARAANQNAFQAMETVMPWVEFTESVTEAEKLARPGDFDSLALIANRYPQLRRYAPQFMDAFEFKGSPASEELLKAVALIRELNASGTRKVPEDAPRAFVRKRWERHVFATDGIDRRFYETCVLAELGKSLRAGDVWVAGSRRYRDFEDYVLTPAAFAAIRTSGLPLAVDLDGTQYLSKRTELLHAELQRVDGLALANQLPEASVTGGVLKISPLDNQESDADLLARQAYGLLPRIKITDLLSEVDGWCDFSRHFTHLRSREGVDDRALLLTGILADGVNLGLSRMADACPEVSLAKLSRVATWHIREETYGKALAEVVNHHHDHGLEFSGHWGDGTTSSSDGQRWRGACPGARAQATAAAPTSASGGWSLAISVALAVADQEFVFLALDVVDGQTQAFAQAQAAAVVSLRGVRQRRCPAIATIGDRCDRVARTGNHHRCQQRGGLCSVKCCVRRFEALCRRASANRCGEALDSGDKGV